MENTKAYYHSKITEKKPKFMTNCKIIFKLFFVKIKNSNMMINKHHSICKQ